MILLSPMGPDKCYTTAPLCLIAFTCRHVWQALLDVIPDESLLDATTAVCLYWCNQRHFAPYKDAAESRVRSSGLPGNIPMQDDR